MRSYFEYCARSASLVWDEGNRAVWEMMGATADRSRETLGASDRGVVMYRRMLAEQIDRVERGEEPTVAVVRDPEKNRIIELLSATKPWRDERFEPVQGLAAVRPQ